MAYILLLLQYVTTRLHSFPKPNLHVTLSYDEMERNLKLAHWCFSFSEVNFCIFIEISKTFQAIN